MRNTFSGILTIILYIYCLILIIVIVISLYFIFKTPLPALEFTDNGFYNYLQIFRFPILTSAALLFIITLLFIGLRIQQVNNSLFLLNREIDSSSKPLLFIKSPKITFDTLPAAGKLIFKFNGDLSPIVEIINSGKEPAIEVKIKFIFDYSSAIKLIKSNDVFHLFSITEKEDSVAVTSEKLGYSSSHAFSSIKSWQKASFILPAFQNTSFTRVTFPDIYLELFYWYNEMTNGDRTKDFPELNCHIEYNRLNGIPVKQIFRINLEELNYSPGLRGDRLYESSSVFSTSVSSV